VEQGLLQGCVLAPLPFIIFVTAVLRVAVEQFSADADVVKYVLCTNKVKEKKGGGANKLERPEKGGITPRRPSRGYNRSGECFMQTTRASLRDRGTTLRR